ncbi:anti-Muellerian hormone type-2 receptor [Echeneis naucrates]|uniref:anti-Muellerian hormone type-2 receptor n=1 Tax=Echeneis naucrates TaxID=173247 RepID=UPI0011144F21|nr:anti-Muellerian hormone type-2 receptor [Echeneis naucrates]
MSLQWWRMILAVECICMCISKPSLLQKRLCVFQLNRTTNTQQNSKYKTAGNVSGSVQACENTHCCLGYFLIIHGRPEVDLLACDVAEKSCPDSTCKAQSRFNSHAVKCVCNADLCNSNITWTPQTAEEPPPTYSYFVDEFMKIGFIILTATLFGLCVMITAAKRRGLFSNKKKNQQVCLPDYSVSTPCSSEIDVNDIELQWIVARGYFATVWQGKYRGSMVAVKVFPAGWKNKFIAEKEVYELPLMKHAGILHFLGTGRKPDGSGWLIVLQVAEYGSLHSYLDKHTTNWMLSLKLCQSLAQGLSYLHSDLHFNDVHKPPVAHRDLSSSNVLVKADGTCVLCDFGCSTILSSFSGHQSWQSNTTEMVGLGTLRYLSPEFLEGSVDPGSSRCLLQGDIYALGLLLWEIWMRCTDLFEGSAVPLHLLPYESELGGNVTLETLISHVVNMDRRPSIPKHWGLLSQGAVLQELLTDCWDCDPDARLTAQCVANRLDSLQSVFSL